MVKRIIKFISREVGDIHEAAYLLAAFAFLSQILGFVRDRLLASHFGAGPLLDTYYASFRIPDLLFTVISTLVSLSVLVPFIVKFENKSNQEKIDFSNTIFTIVSLVSVFLALVALVLSKPILNLMFPAIMDTTFGDNLLLLTRVMLLQPVILSFSSFYSSFIQVYKKFFIYALSPVLYNVGIILGIVILYPVLGIIGLGLGVVIGALLHLIIQIPTIKQHGLNPKFTYYPNLSLLKEVLALSIPRTVALLGNQINHFIMIIIAGTMVSGSISIFSFAFNLQSVPLAIIGMSYSLAAFPTLSRLFSEGDMESFITHIVKAARHIIFWSIPIMVMFIILRAQIVRTILGGGEFDWNDTKLTSAALALFALSIVAQSLSLLFVRGYYSAGETKKPLIFSIISIAATLISSLVLISLYKSNLHFRYSLEALMRVTNIPGSVILILPIAFSFGQLVNTLLLWISFDYQYKWFSDSLWKTIFQSLIASSISGLVTIYSLRMIDTILSTETLVGVFLQAFISGTFGLMVGVIFLILVKNEEIRTVWDTLHKKIFRAKFVGGE